MRSFSSKGSSSLELSILISFKSPVGSFLASLIICIGLLSSMKNTSWSIRFKKSSIICLKCSMKYNKHGSVDYTVYTDIYHKKHVLWNISFTWACIKNINKLSHIKIHLQRKLKHKSIHLILQPEKFSNTLYHSCTSEIQGRLAKIISNSTSASRLL